MVERSIQEQVRLDLVQREVLGKERYGTSLYPFNGREALIDAYQEALDLACYLRQAITEQGLGLQVNQTQSAPVREEPHHRAARARTAAEFGYLDQRGTHRREPGN